MTRITRGGLMVVAAAMTAARKSQCGHVWEPASRPGRPRERRTHNALGPLPRLRSSLTWRRPRRRSTFEPAALDDVTDRDAR